MTNLIDKSFWSEKKVLITGHTGFKGSWMSMILKYLNSEVYGLSIRSEQGMYQEMKKGSIFKKELFADINKIDLETQAELEKINFDYIFHFAAQSLVSEAFDDPYKTIQTNVLGSLNILNLFNNLSSPNLISIATTDKVYKNPSKLNNETSELGAYEYYSLSKVFLEKLIKVFISKNLNEQKYISIIRSGNVLGGGDYSKDRLIPDFLRSIKNSQKLLLRNPNAIRPWQHVLDSLYGYLLAAQYTLKKKKNTIFNLNSQTNNNFSVNRILDELLKVWKINLETEIISSFSEVEILTIDSSKATKDLKWVSKIEISEIAELIYSWEHSKNKHDETMRQIINYFEN